MQQPLSFVFAVIVLGAVVFGLSASLTAFFPRLVRLARRAAEESPARSLLLGAVNLTFVAAVSLTLLAAGERRGPILTILGSLLLAAATSVLAIGVSGTVGLVGGRLIRREDPLPRILAGSLCLTLAGAAPLLGWFVFLPGVVCLSLGSALLGWSRRRAWQDVL